MDKTESYDKTKTAVSTGRGVRTIGPYHLLQKVGEGGMGEVWVAEQEKPIQRRVALKLIKAGMDTRQVIARFEPSPRSSTPGKRRTGGPISSWSTSRASPSRPTVTRIA
jgi:serine/threonine protein kinase